MPDKVFQLKQALNNTRPMPAIGKTIQRLRQAYKLSLGDLAEQSGVSKSIISQIERNESNPTLATVWRLSTALETTIEDVLKHHSPKGILEKLPGHMTPIIKSEDGLCTLKVLNPLNTVDWVQWYEFLAEPKGVLESTAHETGSVEHLTILEGGLRVNVGEEEAEAMTGETLRYRTDTEHRVSNPFDQPARAGMIVILKSSVLQ